VTDLRLPAPVPGAPARARRASGGGTHLARHAAGRRGTGGGSGLPGGAAAAAPDEPAGPAQRLGPSARTEPERTYRSGAVPRLARPGPHDRRPRPVGEVHPQPVRDLLRRPPLLQPLGDLVGQSGAGQLERLGPSGSGPGTLVRSPGPVVASTTVSPGLSVGPPDGLFDLV
jgi:hypothetical protein